MASSSQLNDRAATENASHNHIASLDNPVIKDSDGRVVWNSEEYSFFKSACPRTVNPKLWRQGQLSSIHGLFKVTEGVYQVRGYDISNMTIIEGDTGVVVMDPLCTTAPAKAAFGLYCKHRGDRKVQGVIYSHSHIDHYGGVLGVIDREPTGNYQIPIIAPEGFVEEATSENIFAGPIMNKRSIFMYGTQLPRGPEGHVGVGLGLATSRGVPTLIPPNTLVTHTGQELVVDGIRMVFQMVPETEAPAEINLYLPDRRALCISECATNSMHNITTLRGTLVRDCKKWARHLDETLDLFCHDDTSTTALFSGHHWPTWGNAPIKTFIASQRDLYAYMHDQTIRFMNLGLNGTEIAERLALPPSLADQWHLQGFYGSLSHNVKAIYQRYMTWFDGNPANLWKHPPAEEGKRYVQCMGGMDATVAKGEEFASAGDLRFAATLLDHAVAADPSHRKARAALASVYERLGFGSENATWRNFYLTAAKSLRSDVKKPGLGTPNPRALRAVNPDLTVDQWLDGLSVQLDGEKAAKPDSKGRVPAFVILLTVPEESMSWLIRLSNGTLTYRQRPNLKVEADPADLTLRLKKEELFKVISNGNLEAVKEAHKGDLNLLAQLLDYLGILQASSPERVAGKL